MLDTSFCRDERMPLGWSTGRADFRCISGVAFDKAPQKLQEIIEEHKKEEIKMTWEGDEGRYIIRGYGEQPTGGYSIRADAVELMGDGLHVTTTLIPPQKEQAAAEASYPCIILLIENMDQEVTFEP